MVQDRSRVSRHSRFGKAVVGLVCMGVAQRRSGYRGMISGHVDDFLFGGRDDDQEWQGILEKIQERFKWGDWDKDNFVQCGVLIETTETGFQLSQPKYAEGIEAINICSSRRKDRKSPTTEHEKTKLRAISLLWRPSLKPTNSWNTPKPARTIRC